MKNILILLTCLVGTLPAFSQQKQTRYCLVYVHQKSAFNTARWTIEVIGWRHEELFSFRDTAITSRVWKVTTLETVPDMLNYMSDIGWTFTSTNAVGYLAGVYFFKREFDPGELAPASTQQ